MVLVRTCLCNARWKKFRWDSKAQRMIGWWECMATARLLPFSGTSCHLTPNSTHAVNTPRLLVRIQCSPPFCCRSDSYSWLFCLQYHATFCLLCKYSMLLKGWQSQQFQSPNGQAVHTELEWPWLMDNIKLSRFFIANRAPISRIYVWARTICGDNVPPQNELYHSSTEPAHTEAWTALAPLWVISGQHPGLWSNSITIISQNIKITPVLTKSVDWKADSSDVLGLCENENETGS